MVAAAATPTQLANTFPFELLEELGRGATSRVFEARDQRSGALVALKIGVAEGSHAFLAEEAERLWRARSSRIPALIDLGEIPKDAKAFAGAPFLALTLTPGRALDVRAERSPDERLALALTVARDIGFALAALHEAGVAHGDVKPENILVQEGAGGLEARLVDLGLAGDADLRTPRGGTPRYLPPETWLSCDTGDGRARDRLALGIVLAEILDPSVATADDALSAARSASFPSPFDRLCPALLAQAPGARPRARWIADEAERVLGRAPAEQAEHAVRATYLASRHAEILRASRCESVRIQVEGRALAWLREAVELGRRCARFRGEALVAESLTLDDTDPLTRARWLVGLVGSAAASWPLGSLPSCDDATLAEALIGLGQTRKPASLELVTIERALSGRAPATVDAPPWPEDPPARVAALALALASSPPCRAAIEEVERHGGPAELVRAATDALRRLGEHGRALALSKDDVSVDGLALRADIARRASEPTLAEELARQALSRDPSHDGAAALFARIQLDSGDVEAAEASLAQAKRTARIAEISALVALRRGSRDEALREAARGEALATSDEARSRLQGLLGYLAHAAGDSAKALDAYSRAADHAARASALLEEATYRTGEAASATDRGDLGRALAASARAALLWEHLGRPADAARAVLARAAAFALAGARYEALAAAFEASERAKQIDDHRALAFAAWPITDVLEAGAEAAITAAHRAHRLLARAGTEEDRLRALARLLRHAPAELDPDDLAFGDDLASTERCVASARLEWWGARAEVLVQGEHCFGRPESIVRELVRIVDAPASVASRGPAFHAGARLAARVGDGDAARVLVRAQSEVARKLVEHCPGELRESVLALPWVREARALESTGVSVEQLADIEALVRALGSRDRLRPLLEQVLDSLILWTGVERGVLLLVAPGGKLVPRVGRNLDREDLRGEQLELSRSLAQRAMELGEPVVAVDAFGEMPSVHASVMALKLRSVLAVPLIARGQTLGVAYLDDRVRKGAFGPDELAWVRLVASLAAVAIADAKSRLLLRRKARQAERAQKMLAETLARREAELEVVSEELARTKRTTRYRYENLVGKSEPFRAMLGLLDRVTPTSVPVLLIGESGSGKELVARALHQNGPRARHTFVGENCGAIPEPLLESTLFGHVRGAFTGADRPRAGLFEIADKGTLFLDEIGEMPLSMQTKLLRVLETGEVRPLGSERGRKVDVRIIAATHRDLRKMVSEGRFREDLYYRLDVITVRIPPLRERIDDIPLLVAHLLAKHGGDERVRVSKEAMACLSAYPWPGNVRQLENEVRRALVLSDGIIQPEHLSHEVREGGKEAKTKELGLNLKARLDALSTELLREAMTRTKGNQTKAAELLGLSRFGLQKMLKRLEIEV